MRRMKYACSDRVGTDRAVTGRAGTASMVHTAVFIGLLAVGAMGCTTARQPSVLEQRRADELVNTGTVYLRQGSLREAAAAFEVAEDLAGSAAALDGLGCVALLRRRYTEAERLFWGALERDPRYTHVLGNIALVYELQGKREEARRFHIEALKAYPDSYRFRNNYAAFLHAEKAPATRTQQELTRAQVINTHPVILSNLANIRKQ